VANQVAQWRSELPFVQPYYAVKSNPDKHLMDWLYKEGVFFDCASGRELSDAYGLTHKSSTIIFANPHKTMDDCNLAKSLGVSRTVVDSPEEVQRIAKSGWRPDILIRLAVDDSASRSPFSIKFGAERSAWHEIIRSIYKEKLEFCGLSFHIGSASSDPKQFYKAVNTCKEFVKETGTHAEVIDIGGGFMPDTFADSAKAIRSAKEEWSMCAPKEWISEPGRFFSARSHTLYAPIIAKKKGPKGNGWRYTLDESIYGQFTCIPFDHSTPYWIHCGKSAEKEKQTGFLFGRTCDSIDLIAYSEKMTVMEEDDWLVFPEMGAYTTSSASEFNGFPKPTCYYQDNGWIEKAEQDPSILFPVEAKSSVQLNLL
jgi:ornithine decarboxylase